MAMRRSLWGALAVAVVLVALPLTGDLYFIYLVSEILIFALFALSLNLLLGHAGLISFGHAAYFATLAVIASSVISIEFVDIVLLVPLGVGAGIVAVWLVLTLLPPVLGSVWRLVRGESPSVGTGESLDTDGGFWPTVVRAVMARPWVSVIGSVGLLLALAIPYLQIEPGFTGPSALPEKYEARQAFDLLIHLICCEL